MCAGLGRRLLPAVGARRRRRRARLRGTARQRRRSLPRDMGGATSQNAKAAVAARLTTTTGTRVVSRSAAGGPRRPSGTGPPCSAACDRHGRRAASRTSNAASPNSSRWATTARAPIVAASTWPRATPKTPCSFPPSNRGLSGSTEPQLDPSEARASSRMYFC